MGFYRGATICLIYQLIDIFARDRREDPLCPDALGQFAECRFIESAAWVACPLREAFDVLTSDSTRFRMATVKFRLADYSL